MKKSFKAAGLLITLIILLITIPAGCAPSGTGQPAEPTGAPGRTAAELEEAELSMYLLGDPARDEDLMLAELNGLMSEELNATLKIGWISWGEYQNKYQLVLASGEPIDLIYTSSWTFFASSVAKGGFLPLDDLLAKYAPKTWEGYRENVWEDARVNGKIYAVPQDYDEMGPWGYVVRGDMMDKYNVPEIKTLEDFEVYLDAVGKDESGIIPYNAGSFDMTVLPIFVGRHICNSTHVSLDTAGVWSENTNNRGETYILADDPRYEQFLKLMRTWYEKGYWPESVLQNKVNAFDSFVAGNSASCIANTGDANNIYAKVSETHPEWDVRYFEAYPQYPKEVNIYINNAMAIPFSAKNPERAMILLEKFHQDERYYDLIHFAIKGRNYEIDADGKVTLPSGVSAADNGYLANAPGSWGLNDRKFFRPSAKNSPEIDAAVEDMIKKAVKNPLRGFIFRTDAVNSEVAECQELEAQYVQPLTWGLVDPGKVLPEFRKKLHEAGIDKIKAEADKQIAEFLKSKKQ